MTYDVADYNHIVRDWLLSPDGTKFAEQYGGFNPYSEEEMIAIATELYMAIVKAYKAEIQTEGADWFDLDTIRVGKPTKAKNGKIRVRIIFSEKGLARRSLHRSRYSGDPDYPYKSRIYYNRRKTQYDDWQFTGKGVYDIFGLFTQGYDTKPVYGEWWDNESNTGEAGFNDFKGRSLPKRGGSDFITKTINRFRKKYPQVEVEYPKLWGGTK